MARTIVQRAVSRAKKVNRKVLASMPLFDVAGVADQFLTDVEREARWLYRRDTLNYWWFQGMRAFETDALVRAVQFRLACRVMATEAQFSDYERRALWFPQRGSYLVEFWRDRAAEVGVGEFCRL